MKSKLTRNQNSNASSKTSSVLLLICMDKMENSFLSPLHLHEKIYDITYDTHTLRYIGQEIYEKRQFFENHYIVTGYRVIF